MVPSVDSPLTIEDGKLLNETVAIFDRRITKHGNVVDVQILMQ